MNTLILGCSNVFQITPDQLQGCVNDGKTINNFAKLNRVVPYYLDPYFNEAYTRDAIYNACLAAIQRGIKGDWIWPHFSCHGTTIPIAGHNHGALVTYSSQWRDPNSFILDTLLMDLCNRAAVKEINVFITIDACEFGDSVRGIEGLADGAPQILNRYLAPPDDLQMVLDHNLEQGGEIKDLVRKLAYATTIAFCERGPGKTCADVRDAGGAFGAGTHYFTPQVKPHVNASNIVSGERAVLAQQQFDQKPVWSGVDRPWCITPKA